MENLTEGFAALLGIDWSDEKHDVCLLDASTGKQQRSVLKHSPEALDEWAASLRARFGGQKVAVCLEQSRGPLIFALLKYDFLVLYPVNPATLKKYREAFSPSGAKDDPADADYLLDILRHHRERLRPWLPGDEKTRLRQYLLEHRRRLVDDRTRTGNRLTSLLKGYFPQVLQWFPDIRTELVCDFLLRWPTLADARRARRATVDKFLCEHNSVRKATNAARFAQIREAVPLTTDEAVINSSVLMVRALCAQMKATIAALTEFEAEIERLCARHQDFELFASFPGAGTLHAARLTVAFGAERGRWATVQELLCLSGIAPVMERSGKQTRIRRRYLCPKFLRQSFREYAGESIRHSFWARAFYSSQRAKGKSHQAAVRALAFRWIRIMWRCWQTRTHYSEMAYLESLRRKGSDLLKYAANHTA